jgi:hypothetical protein
MSLRCRNDKPKFVGHDAKTTSMKVTTIDGNGCQLEDVAAYLDGELSDTAQATFEEHLKSCTDCAAELRLQRQLLCTLDFAFNDTRPFELPRDFTRVVTAQAESDLSGMRNWSERRRALQLCAILALVSFALLGAASRTLVFDPVRSFLRVTGSLISLVWQAIYDAGTGVAVVVRVVGRAIILGPHGLWLLVPLAFVISLSLLPLLIAKYHRAHIAE